MHIFRLAPDTDHGDIYDYIGKGYIPTLKACTVFTNIDFLVAGCVFFEMMRSLQIFCNNLSPDH